MLPGPLVTVVLLVCLTTESFISFCNFCMEETHPRLEVVPLRTRVAPVPGIQRNLHFSHEEVSAQGIVMPDREVQDPALQVSFLNLVLQSQECCRSAGRGEKQEKGERNKTMGTSLINPSAS